MRPHERLEVWQTAVDFVASIYRETESFPKEERYGLTSQIRRAAVSIAANIAEGAGRDSSKEFAYFLQRTGLRERACHGVGDCASTVILIGRGLLGTLVPLLTASAE